MEILSNPVTMTAIELVAIWVEPGLEESAEVVCCLLNFFIQSLLAKDSISGIDQGTALSPYITKILFCMTYIMAALSNLGLSFEKLGGN